MTSRRRTAGKLIDLIVRLFRKLLSVWTHLQAYQTHETVLAEQAAGWPSTKREHSQELSLQPTARARDLA